MGGEGYACPWVVVVVGWWGGGTAVRGEHLWVASEVLEDTAVPVPLHVVPVLNDAVADGIVDRCDVREWMRVNAGTRARQAVCYCDEASVGTHCNRWLARLPRRRSSSPCPPYPSNLCAPAHRTRSLTGQSLCEPEGWGAPVSRLWCQ